MPFSQLDCEDAGREDGVNFPSILSKIVNVSKIGKIGKTTGSPLNARLTVLQKLNLSIICSATFTECTTVVEKNDCTMA